MVLTLLIEGSFSWWQRWMAFGTFFNGNKNPHQRTLKESLSCKGILISATSVVAILVFLARPCDQFWHSGSSICVRISILGKRKLDLVFVADWSKYPQTFFPTDLLLNFRRAQLNNSEALPFTNGQYVVIELAEILLLFVFFCFAKVCLSHRS